MRYLTYTMFTYWWCTATSLEPYEGKYLKLVIDKARVMHAGESDLTLQCTETSY